MEGTRVPAWRPYWMGHLVVLGNTHPVVARHPNEWLRGHSAIVPGAGALEMIPCFLFRLATAPAWSLLCVSHFEMASWFLFCQAAAPAWS
jgi:hypothetical protein